jgi:hypothetical protein
MNKQEIFTTVATHLLTQNEKALDEDNNCVYRTDSGLKCAIGCIITDEMYHRDMDEQSMTALQLIKADRFTMPDWFCDNVMEFVELQSIHDCLDPEDWRKSLIFFSEKEELEMPEVAA